MDVYIDPECFPHRFTGDNLEFDVGADEWYAFGKSTIVFEPNGLLARRDVSDVCIKSIRDLGGSVYRMTLYGDENIHEGDLLNMRHCPRIHAGVFSEKCSDITV